MRVVEAKDLGRSAFGSRPDPFVVVILDDRKQSTRVKKSTSHPGLWRCVGWLFVGAV